MHNVTLSLTDEAKDYIIENGSDNIYGARPLKRFISRNIETLIAKELILGNVNFGKTINIDVKNNELVLN